MKTILSWPLRSIVWYNGQTLTPNSSKSQDHRCFQCGSPLIFVSEKTEKTDGNMYPMTTTIYRCSNKVCQAEIDKKLNERKILRKKQEKEKEERAKLKITSKK